MTSADGEDRLFEVPVVELVEPLVKGEVDKTFRPYDPHPGVFVAALDR